MFVGLHPTVLSMVVPTHPTSGDPRSQGGDCPASRSPRGGALVRPVEVFFCCQPLGWRSPPVGVGIYTKAVPERGKCFSKVTVPTPDLGRPEVGKVGTTIDRSINSLTATQLVTHHSQSSKVELCDKEVSHFSPPCCHQLSHPL